MTILQHRSRSNANASLISMAQRFSDIVIVFLGLYMTCFINDVEFDYRHVLTYLSVLVVFQMIGGITDFYRSWRGVKISTELNLILKNWTISLLIGLGITSLFSDLDISIILFLEWFLIVALGFLICRSTIRLTSGVLRKLGYNTRRVAVVGSMPAGINLLKNFLEEPWLGFVVVEIDE